jgi:hypothetical protein
MPLTLTAIPDTEDAAPRPLPPGHWTRHLLRLADEHDGLLPRKERMLAAEEARGIARQMHALACRLEGGDCLGGVPVPSGMLRAIADDTQRKIGALDRIAQGATNATALAIWALDPNGGDMPPEPGGMRVVAGEPAPMVEDE